MIIYHKLSPASCVLWYNATEQTKMLRNSKKPQKNKKTADPRLITFLSTYSYIDLYRVVICSGTKPAIDSRTTSTFKWNARLFREQIQQLLHLNEKFDLSNLYRTLYNNSHTDTWLLYSNEIECHFIFIYAFSSSESLYRATALDPQPQGMFKSGVIFLR